MPIPKKIKTELPKTARERVYLQLKQWIIDGTMQPDEKILDSELAEYFSVSRTPVREAMQILADQKLIIITPGKESRIAPIDPEQADMSYRLISTLYCTALEFSFPYLTDDQISALKQLNADFTAALKRRDSSEAHRLDRAFHSYFLLVRPNDFLANFIDTLDCHVERIETAYFNMPSGFRSESVSQHEQIISALEQKDLSGAIAATKQNWMQTLDFLK